MWPRLVAFTGYAGVGKDEAAKVLLARGYVRHNFGDIIKRELDVTVRRYFGFTAFTEDREQKTKIRPILESWGECRYEAILKRFLETLPSLAVNTRLMRVQEAEEWRDRGGVIIHVHRPGVRAATEWEADRLHDLYNVRVISDRIINDGTREQLASVVSECLNNLGGSR